VSEQHAEQISGGSNGAEPVTTTHAAAASASIKPDATDAAVPAIHQVEPSVIAPDHEAPKADASSDTPKVEPVVAGQAKPDTIGLDQIKPDPIKIDAPKVEPIKAETMDIAPAKVEPVKGEAPRLALASLAAGAPALAVAGGAKDEATGSAAPTLDVAKDMPKDTPKDTPKDMPADLPKTGRLVMAPAANDSVRAEPAFAPAAAAANANSQPPSAPTAAADAGRTAKTERPDPARASVTPPAARRALPVAAMLALAVLAGAVGGALATMALVHGSRGQATTAAANGNAELSASVGKIENDIATLKASLEQTNQTSLVELNKTAERLDKVEKTQSELAKVAKPGDLQKLSEAMERMRTAQASTAATPAATRERETPAATAREHETTASVTPAASQPTAITAAGVPAQAAAAPPVVGRLPVVEGWVLRDVGRGGALIEGRQGLYEVYAGDPVPGLGKVDAIRKQDGRWVVVTSRGLVVAR
jgi:hypothetical protein